MTTKTQYFKTPDGEIMDTITHIYSENGHFEKNGKKQGWHIQLGTNDAAENYTEVIDNNVTHAVPEVLEDEIIEFTEDGEGDEG